jgi:exopolysaccharide production protein ExoZ
MTIYADPIVLDFLFGMIVAKLIINEVKLPLFLAIPAIVVGFTYLFVPVAQLGELLPTWSLFTSISAFLVVFGCLSMEDRVGNKISSLVLFLGAASYSLYLFHPLIAPIAPTILKKLGLIWPHASVALSIAIAGVGGSIAYVAIERPATRMLTKLARRRLAFYRR